MSRLPLPAIEVVPIDELRPHEEYDRRVLFEVAMALQSDGVLRDPILVDGATLMILDGTHRYWALRRLGCLSVPAAKYDYLSPEVRVASWSRCIASPAFLIPNRMVRAEFATLGRAIEALRVREASLAILSRCGSQLLFMDPFDIRESYSLLRDMETDLRRRGCPISYATEADALSMLSSGEASLVIMPPSIEKREALEAAVSGRLFPIKSTRHILPSRPVGINVPLAWLKEPPDQAGAKVNERISSLRFRKAGPGAILQGRRYEEEVYIGEPSNP